MVGCTHLAEDGLHRQAEEGEHSSALHVRHGLHRTERLRTPPSDIERSQNIKQIERIDLTQLESYGKFDRIGAFREF